MTTREEIQAEARRKLDAAELARQPDFLETVVTWIIGMACLVGLGCCLYTGYMLAANLP